MEQHHPFEPHPRLLAVERICRQEIGVHQELFIPSAAHLLIKLGVRLMPYPTVAASLAHRGRAVYQPIIRN